MVRSRNRYYSNLTTVVGLGVILLGLIAGPLDSHAQLQAPAQSPQVEGNRGDAYLKMMEDAVVKLASSVTETFNSAFCVDLWYLDYCDHAQNGQCNEYLQDIGCPSLRVSMLKSSVAYPRNDPTSIYTLDPAQARTICRTTKLDPVFRKLFHQSQYYAVYYVGFLMVRVGASLEGSHELSVLFWFQEQEGQADKTCSSYDARRRPWYSAAISNNTHLVILLDTRKEPLGPEYTEQSNTLDVFKDYASKLLDTVYYGDLVNAVTFSSKAQALEPRSIEVLFNESDPQRHVELESLRTKLTQALLDTGDSQSMLSNLTAGLQEALRLFDRAANMKNIIVFTSGDISYDDLSLNVTLKQLSDNLIRLFIFSLNSKGDNLDRVAAGATGFHIRLNSPVSQNPLYRMYAYFSYVAVLHNKSRTTNPPFWTPSYQDYYDTGEIISVIYPTFTRDEPSKFLGVAAIDILYNEIEDILSDFRGALENREESTPDVRVIGADLFNSIQLPNFDDASVESCNESLTEKAFCEGNTPRKGQNFLDRTCCRGCGGNADSHRWKTIVIVVGAAVGGLVFVTVGLALLKHFCWDPNRITLDASGTESDITSSGSYTQTGINLVAERSLLKETQKRTKVIPSEVRHTSQRFAAGTVELTSH
ncbi:hypothetical protein R1sor_021905 [Riccia sorocarpa]|uniref:VWFA domain-containing protein n=1 Tax=Riccia sorocarpa TaxID=122646 RepID=A0ABD3GP59_9MARC